ncbi:MAG: aldo/keto reductase [Pseudomonadales bacterium]
MTLQWGILATGRIATALADALSGTPENRLVAVASRTADRAREFAARYPDTRAYADYDALLADPDVHIVYVATPHPQHAQWTIRALEAGKHVLCEKPLGLNAPQVMAMTHAAATHQRFLMEAFMYRCHPQTRMVQQLIRAGAIGKVRHIAASFGYQTPFDEHSRLFANSLGGGGILDVGCYPVSLARAILQAEPVSVQAHGHLGSTGVDEWSSALLGFDDGVSAQVNTSIRLGIDNTARISGTDGYIHLPRPWLPADDVGHWSFTLNTGGENHTISGTGKPLYVYEVQAAARAIEAGKQESPAMSWADSLGNARTLDAWRQAVGLTYREEAPATHRGPLRGLRRPGPGQGRIAHASPPGLRQSMSRLVMGCDNQPNASHAAVMWDHYLEQGGNAFDTAYVYGDGLMERFLGYWHEQRGVRNDIVIIGKGAHTPHCFPEFIHRQLDESLQRLRTDYVDVYFLHRDNVDVPVSEFVDALNEEVTKGRIRSFGGSNWTLARLQAANDYARKSGRQGFTALSNNFSLARMVNQIWPGTETAWEADYRRYLQHGEVALMPWSSQARGFFTPWVDSVLTDHSARTSSGTRVEPTVDELKRTWFADDNFERRRRAITLASRLDTSAINVALAYVLAQPFPVFALIGPRTLAELDDCINAQRLRLSPEMLAWLNLESGEAPV